MILRLIFHCGYCMAIVNKRVAFETSFDLFMVGGFEKQTVMCEACQYWNQARIERKEDCFEIEVL